MIKEQGINDQGLRGSARGCANSRREWCASNARGGASSECSSLPCPCGDGQCDQPRKSFFQARSTPKTSASERVREVAALEPLRPIQTGVAKGELKGRDLVPSADWALSLALPDGAYPVADLDRETALRFLHRDSIFLKDAPKGFVLVRFEGHPLGFVKNLGSRCNNLHPQGRKIKMDV